MTDVADSESRPVIRAPTQLRIIGWLWIAAGVSAIVTDYCATRFFSRHIGLDFAWFFPVVGLGLLNYVYALSSIARAIAWIVVVVSAILFAMLIVCCIPFVFGFGEPIDGEDVKMFLASATALSVVVAFFAWQLKVLYTPAVRSLTVRGPSKHRPRPSRRIDLLSLFFFIALCAITIAPLTMMRGLDPAAPGSGDSTISVKGNQESVYTTAGTMALFGSKRHGRAFLATEVASVSHRYDGNVVIKLFDGSEVKVDTEKYGIVIHNGERLETSQRRVPGSVFMRWAKQRRQSAEPEEASLAAFFKFMEQIEEQESTTSNGK